MNGPVAVTCWLLVHPDGRVKWDSIDFREDRPKIWVWLTRWRWQRWMMQRDQADRVFDPQWQLQLDRRDE